MAIIDMISNSPNVCWHLIREFSVLEPIRRIFVSERVKFDLQAEILEMLEKVAVG